MRETDAVWRCGSHEISLARPRIMGVLNVTPDSFSDGGQFVKPEDAIARGLQMLDEGADIIDIGGESTRPGFKPVSADEEGKRVIPVIRELAEAGAIISIDTRHPEVARLAVKLGASIINDVTGFTNPEMVRVACECNAGLVIMHAGDIASSATRQSVTLNSEAAMHAVSGLASPNRHFTLPEEAPLMRRVMGFLGDQARELMRQGVARERICVDPGPGFGKGAAEDVVIQRAMPKLVSMGYPVLCAVSRKRFVGAVSGVTEAAQRDSATAGICIAAVEKGARILRVHNVVETVNALNSYWAMAHPDARRAFVALGSNVGDRVEYLVRACKKIDEIPLTCVTGVSHAYESEPAYGIALPVANAVAEIKTELSPMVLLGALLDVENQLGRKRKKGEEGHGPRTIDCDLVWMEGETHAGKKLALPHPRMAERDFVITPMEDLMHDPVRFLAHSGIDVVSRENRVGIVREDLGEVAWESAEKPKSEGITSELPQVPASKEPVQAKAATPAKGLTSVLPSLPNEPKDAGADDSASSTED